MKTQEFLDFLDTSTSDQISMVMEHSNGEVLASMIESIDDISTLNTPSLTLNELAEIQPKFQLLDEKLPRDQQSVMVKFKTLFQNLQSKAVKNEQQARIDKEQRACIERIEDIINTSRDPMNKLPGSKIKDIQKKLKEYHSQKADPEQTLRAIEEICQSKNRGDYPRILSEITTTKNKIEQLPDQINQEVQRQEVQRQEVQRQEVQRQEVQRQENWTLDKS